VSGSPTRGDQLEKKEGAGYASLKNHEVYWKRKRLRVENSPGKSEIKPRTSPLGTSRERVKVEHISFERGTGSFFKRKKSTFQAGKENESAIGQK